MQTNKLASVISMVLFSSHAFAGAEEVAACAENLSDPAKLILQEVAPKLQPGVDGREIMRTTVTGMVKSGEIKRSEARSSAQAAGECLMKYQD